MLFKFAFRNVFRNRRRSLIALLTVAMGVFGLLFIQSFFSGLIALHKKNSIHSRFGHGQINTIDYLDRAHEKPWHAWMKDGKKITGDLQSWPEVKYVFPRVQFYALLTNGDVSVAGRGQGIEGVTESKFFTEMNFTEGGPIADQSDGVVLGVGLARALNVVVGDRVTVLANTIHGSINAIDTRVTGVFHIGLKEADDTLFQVQLSQARILLDTDLTESIAIGLYQDEDWQSVASRFRQAYPSLEIASVYKLDKVWAENGRSFLNALMNVFRLVFLAVILLAIYNSASATIMERRREFGMLRANGDSSRELIMLVVMEGAGIAMVGSIVGVGLILLLDIISGAGIPMPPTPGTNRELPVKLDLQTAYLLTAAMMGFGAAAFATFISGLQVLKTSIVAAIRSPG